MHAQVATCMMRTCESEYTYAAGYICVYEHIADMPLMQGIMYLKSYVYTCM